MVSLFVLVRQFLRQDNLKNLKFFTKVLYKISIFMEGDKTDGRIADICT